METRVFTHLQYSGKCRVKASHVTHKTCYIVDEYTPPRVPSVHGSDINGVPAETLSRLIVRKLSDNNFCHTKL